MIFKAILIGFVVKAIGSFDDIFIRIPLLVNITKTLKGRLIFSFGTFLSQTLAILISYNFASHLSGFPYIRPLVSIFVFLMSMAVLLNLFGQSGTGKLQIAIAKKMKPKRIRALVLSGFVLSFMTSLDDMVVMPILFIGHQSEVVYRILGIYLALLIQIGIVVYFSKFVEKMKYRKEIAVAALMVLSFLIWIDVV